MITAVFYSSAPYISTNFSWFHSKLCSGKNNRNEACCDTFALVFSKLPTTCKLKDFLKHSS